MGRVSLSFHWSPSFFTSPHLMCDLFSTLNSPAGPSREFQMVLRSTFKLAFGKRTFAEEQCWFFKICSFWMVCKKINKKRTKNKLCTFFYFVYCFSFCNVTYILWNFYKMHPLLGNNFTSLPLILRDCLTTLMCSPSHFHQKPPCTCVFQSKLNM